VKSSDAKKKEEGREEKRKREGERAEGCGGRRSIYNAFASLQGPSR